MLRGYCHHDVRTISAVLLEHIADARLRGRGLALPPESLFSLASRIEEQLASAGLDAASVTRVVSQLLGKVKV